MTTAQVAVDDVIQLRPEHPWGPTLCVVTEVHDWGVQCYARCPLSTAEHGQRWANAYVRVEHGQFERVGVAVWVQQ